MMVDDAPSTERDVTNDVTYDVADDSDRPVFLIAVDYDYVGRRLTDRDGNSTGDGQETAEDVMELAEELDVDSGHGTVATSVYHGADTTRSSYRTSIIDEDVSTLY